MPRSRNAPAQRTATPSPCAPTVATMPAAQVEAQESPLDVLLVTMRALMAAARGEKTGVEIEIARQACDIAKAAAPYVHARPGANDRSGAPTLRHEDALKELD